MSSTVQTSPSSHGAALSTCSQSPLAGLQLSSVQPSASSQFLPGPAPQIPPEQASSTLHGFPSLHGAVLSVCLHPVRGSHASSVHGLPSPHAGGGPPTQLPPAQLSFVVQASSSLQGRALFACTQPVAGLHESVVQTLPSPQAMNAPVQLPAAHASPLVQALPSLQGSLLFVWTHPLAGLQESSVHGFASPQTRASPPHEPAAQWSFVVHAFPSLQGAVLFVCVQPLAGLHASSVQTSPSLQLGGGPPTQTPAEQASLSVQALPSSHGAVLNACAQPVTGLQESVVQTSPSLQSGAPPPWHAPPAQVSSVEHALPSLHGSLLFTCVQPVAGLHPSSVQPLESSQLTSSLTHP